MNKPVLNPEKRQLIISLITIGCSLRKAALYVGCAPSTITNTAKRDPAFAEQIARASQSLEVEVLRSLRQASKNERYWRAGAWILERKNPQDFSLRPLELLTPDEVVQLFSQLFEDIFTDLPDRTRHRVVKKLQRITKTINREYVEPLSQPMLPDIPTSTVSQ